MQGNQSRLSSEIEKSNSISLEIIDRFNNSVQNSASHQIIFKEKITVIANFTLRHSFFEKSVFARDLTNQMIHLYEIIISTLQDIENSLTFARLNILHSRNIIYCNYLRKYHATRRNHRY